VLLHDAPGTGLALDGLARGLAATHQVMVPDLPGSGLSEAPAGDILVAAAETMLTVADALGVERFRVAAAGTGAAVAAALAARAGARVSEYSIAHGAPVDPARIAPEISLSPTGAHWVQAWLMLRDGQIYAPWYDGRIAAQRATQGNFDAGWLHDQTVALMEGRATYHLLPRAAAAYPAAESLKASGARVTRLPDDAFVTGFTLD
jgi:pimeloyl-ACP methyl ester carboxylesterase